MISGDVCMELEPEPLDAVLVGTVGGEKVQPDSTSPLGQGGLHDLALMDDVVVEDQVKHPGTAIAPQQSAQQIQEEPAPFLVAFDRDQMARPMVQGSGQKALLVLSRGEDPTLLAGQGPVGANAGVEVDVHLVDVERFLVPFQGREHRSDLSQAPRADGPFATDTASEDEPVPTERPRSSEKSRRWTDSPGRPSAWPFPGRAALGSSCCA